MLYRNQTNTLTQISMLSRMRITTTQEAVAYLRASAMLDTQVAEVLQRASLREQQLINQANRQQVQQTQQTQAQPVSEPTVETVEPTKPFAPENISSDEGFTEKEAESRVAELKKAKRTKKSEQQSEQQSEQPSEQPAKKEGN